MAHSFEIDTVTGPVYWASALVNGDTSGMTPAEFDTMQAWLAPLDLQGWAVIDVARDSDGEGIEARFTWNFDLYGGTARGGEVIDYVVHRHCAPIWPVDTGKRYTRGIGALGRLLGLGG